MADPDFDALAHQCAACAAREPCNGVAARPIETACWDCRGERAGCQTCHGDGRILHRQCPNQVPLEAVDLVNCADMLSSGGDPFGVPFAQLPEALRRQLGFAATWARKYREPPKTGSKFPRLPPVPAEQRGDPSDAFRREMPGATFR